MTWDELARQAWDAYSEQEEQRTAGDRAREVADLARHWQRLGLGELPELVREKVPTLLPLYVLPPLGGWRIGLIVAGSWVALYSSVEGGPWMHEGDLGTAADLGRLLDLGPTAGQTRGAQTNGEQLELILRALAADAVAEAIEGRL